MIIFIHGNDTFRAKTKLEELKTKFFKDIDPNKLNYTNLGPDGLEANKIISSIKSAPFMATKRLIIINNLLKIKAKDKSLFDNLYNFLKDYKNEKSIIIFFEENNFIPRDIKKKDADLLRFLINQKSNFEFVLLEGHNLSKWINQIANNEGLEIEPQAIDCLMRLLPQDTWGLSKEVNKLIAYTKGLNQKVILKEYVEKMVMSESSESIFNLVDCIGQKQKSRALKLLHNILDSGVSELYVLSMVTRQFRIIMMLKEAQHKSLDNYTLAKIVGLNAFVVQKCMGQANNFTKEKLVKIYSALLELDKRLKTSSKESCIVLFDLLVLSI